MKKTLIFVLTAMILVLAASCSPQPKMTGIQIDTSLVVNAEGFDSPSVDNIELQVGDTDYPINKAEFAKKSIFIALQPGDYTGVQIELGSGSVKIGTETPDQFWVVDPNGSGKEGSFTVIKDQVLNCILVQR